MAKAGLFLAVWPDEKISIVQSPDLHSLYNDLETIGPVEECHFKKLSDTENLCLTFQPVNTVKKYGDDIADYCGDFPNTQMETMGRYEELLKTGELSDVTVHAGTLQLKCHRLILSVQCPYFAAMFRSEYSEKSKGEVYIQSFPSYIVRTIIEYLYSGKVDVSKEAMKSYYYYQEVVEEERIEIPPLRKSQNCQTEEDKTDSDSKDINETRTKNDRLDVNEFSRVNYSVNETSDQCRDRVNANDNAASDNGNSPKAGESSGNSPNTGQSSEKVWCDGIRQSKILDIKISQVFWRDLYLAGDYFSLPSLQDVCKVHLHSLCYQVKQMMRTHQFCHCKENATILKLAVLFYQLGSELPDLASLQQLTCQLVKTFTDLEETNIVQLKKAEYVCKVVPEEMKRKVLSSSEGPKTFLSWQHFELATLVENIAKSSDESGLCELENKLTAEEDNCRVYLDDINCLHAVVELYHSYKDCIRTASTKEAHNNHFSKLLSVLLNTGVNVNKANQGGNTPLHIAASYFIPVVVKMLLEAGADVRCTNKHDRLPIEEAWHQFDTWVGISMNTEENDSFAKLSRRDHETLHNKGTLYKETASLLMERMVLSGTKHQSKGRKRSDFECVSSEFIDECLHGTVHPREFKLVQSGGSLSHRFLQVLSETLYPSLYNSMNSVHTTFSGREEDEKVQDKIKMLYGEASLHDLERKEIPLLASLQTRTSVKCRTGCPSRDLYKMENCGRCLEILGESSRTSAIPQDVMNIHGNIRKFWL